MRYKKLGKTGLEVSIVALGCGGHSRLGQSYGVSVSESVKLVQAALDEGINFIDTAEAYKTEPIVGQAIAESSSPRDRVVISTKKSVHNNPSEADIFESVEKSLCNLKTDYIDIYHAHGVRPHQYEYVRNEVVPVFEKLKKQGKICHIGITEFFIGDSGHEMLSRAVKDDCWEVVMVGLNMLNFSARDRVLKMTQQKQIGTMLMFAVRRALSRPEALAELLAELAQIGKIDAEISKQSDPLGFLCGSENGKAKNIMEAAYRFCSHEAGIDSVQTGTGSIGHLKENVRSILADDLLAADRRQIETMFKDVDCASGN